MTSYVVIDTDLAKDLRKGGATWKEIASQLESTVYLVRRALNSAGVKYYKRWNRRDYFDKPLLTSYNLARVKRLKSAGATWKELQRITGIDAGKLARYVRSH